MTVSRCRAMDPTTPRIIAAAAFALFAGVAGAPAHAQGGGSQGTIRIGATLPLTGADAEQNQMLYVNGGGAASAIYKRGYKWVFGLLAPVELLAESMMKWIDEQQKAGKLPKPSKIALLWENTSHGKDFRRGVSDFAK